MFFIRPLLLTQTPALMALTAQFAASSSEATDPIQNPWLQFGILGLVIVGILYLKVIVPGWVYQAEVERGKQKDDIIAKKDEEIARLRDLAENQTIPLLQRAMVLVEHAEDSWMRQPYRQGGGFPSPTPPTGG